MIFKKIIHNFVILIMCMFYSIGVACTDDER